MPNRELRATFGRRSRGSRHVRTDPSNDSATSRLVDEAFCCPPCHFFVGVLQAARHLSMIEQLARVTFVELVDDQNGSVYYAEAHEHIKCVFLDIVFGEVHPKGKRRGFLLRQCAGGLQQSEDDTLQCELGDIFRSYA